MTTNPAVFSAGTINADFLFGIDAQFEPGASLVARRSLRTSGGRAGNVAVMARRLGRPARLFGCLGGDELAKQALAGPRAAGVDVAGVRHVSADTGLVAILVGESGTKTMALAPGANDAFSESDGERLAVELRGAPEGSVLVVDTDVSPDTLTPALTAARENALACVLDPTRPDRVSDSLGGRARRHRLRRAGVLPGPRDTRGDGPPRDDLSIPRQRQLTRRQRRSQ
jgi:sugar/nucleoside kinase (ribokinase family)